MYYSILWGLEYQMLRTTDSGRFELKINILIRLISLIFQNQILSLLFSAFTDRKKEVRFGQLDWTFSCDFPGNDIESALGRGEHCSGTCLSVPGIFFWVGVGGEWEQSRLKITGGPRQDQNLVPYKQLIS